MKSYIELKNERKIDLPPEFRDDDVRYPESLVEYFLGEFTRAQDVVFDPFAGFGTTLLVAERMGRVPFGIEANERRYEYVRARLAHAQNLIHGDSLRLAAYSLPPYDFSLTSPPYMHEGDGEDPLATDARSGGGYKSYLKNVRAIYEQMGRLMKREGRAVIEISNLKRDGRVTTLAWDVAAEVSQVLRFEGEIIVCWDEYGYGYDHSYCLVFSKRA